MDLQGGSGFWTVSGGVLLSPLVLLFEIQATNLLGNLFWPLPKLILPVKLFDRMYSSTFYKKKTSPFFDRMKSKKFLTEE